MRVTISPAKQAVLCALLVGCGAPATPPATPAPTATVAAIAPTAAPSAVPEAPKEALPAMHPCVPDFISKELHACEPGAEVVDYSAVANAMSALTQTIPDGPLMQGRAGVQRPLSDREAKVVAISRAFLCRAPAGELDDEHATAAFDLGRLYLQANHFEEAAVFLHDAAILDPQTHAEVEYAARFLMESVRALAKSRPECGPTLTAMTAAIDAHVCKGPGADQRVETCAALAKDKPSTP